MQTRNDRTRQQAEAERGVAPAGGVPGQCTTPVPGSAGSTTTTTGNPGVRERRPWRGVDRMIRTYETK